MNWIGKLAGALLGYIATRSVLGALIGAVLGHQFDRGMAAPRQRRRSGRPGHAPSVDRQRLFFESTFLVMGHLTKLDGRVSEAEIDAARDVMRRMHLGERETRLAMDLFGAGKRADFPVDEQVERLRRHCGSHPELLQTFLEIQVDVALAKGEISPPERELLSRIAARLGMNRLSLARIEALLRARRFGAGAQAAPSTASLGDAYRILGVDPQASDAEVKKAYRRLMNQHHPDKQMARGLPESMLELAKERTGEIRAAYERIREHRGFR
jgi:DnaJ like chaperone protein